MSAAHTTTIEGRPYRLELDRTTGATVLAPAPSSAPRSRAAVRREIRDKWTTILERAGVAGVDAPTLPGDITLLGSGTKTEKGEAKGHITAIVYAAPAFSLWGSVEKANGRTLCPFATGTGARAELGETEGCIDWCLAQYSGRMPLPSVANSRRWKAALLVGARALFLELLRIEIRAFGRNARAGGWIPVVRVDGGTDTGIGALLAGEFEQEGTTLYDYTKVYHRADRFSRGGYATNYHVTFSFSGSNELHCRELLAKGVNVAAVFLDDVPATFLGAPTYDADAHDLRFLDPARGGIAALSLKSLSKVDADRARRGGFIVDARNDSRCTF